MGYGRGVGLGVGGESGINEQGSLVAEAQAGGFGGGFSIGGDHSFGVKAVVFGVDVSIKLPRLPSPPSSPAASNCSYDPHIGDML